MHYQLARAAAVAALAGSAASEPKSTRSTRRVAFDASPTNGTTSAAVHPAIGQVWRAWVGRPEQLLQPCRLRGELLPEE